MKFGVCGDIEVARQAKLAGFDYFEWSVPGLLHPRESEEVFQAALQAARATNLPCPVLNLFLPADLKVTGPEVSLDELASYCDVVFQRAETAGVEIIVFGSGAARQIPDGFDPAEARKQMVEFLNLAAPKAQKHGVRLAIEPLNRHECNFINEVEQGAALAREVNNPAIALLVDGYHWAENQEAPDGILDARDILIHAHIATPGDRIPPHAGDPCETFMSTLQQAGYNGRLSIEGNLAKAQNTLAESLKILRGESPVIPPAEVVTETIAPQKEVFKFPMNFNLKVIGRNEPDFETFVVETVSQYVGKEDQTGVDRRLSGKDQYLALTVNFVASSREQLDSVYKALSASPRVLMMI